MSTDTIFDGSPRETVDPDNRALVESIGPDLWNRVTDMICTLHGEVDQRLAESILDETVLYFRFLGMVKNQAYAPSAMVDMGVHPWLHFTDQLAMIAEAIGGRGFRIRHEPAKTRPVVHPGNSAIPTQDAMKLRGLRPRPFMWAGSGPADCPIMMTNHAFTSATPELATA